LNRRSRSSCRGADHLRSPPTCLPRRRLHEMVPRSSRRSDGCARARLSAADTADRSSQSWRSYRSLRRSQAPGGTPAPRALANVLTRQLCRSPESFALGRLASRHPPALRRDGAANARRVEVPRRARRASAGEAFAAPVGAGRLLSGGSRGAMLVGADATATRRPGRPRPWQQFGNSHTIRCVRCVRETPRNGRSRCLRTHLDACGTVQVRVWETRWRFESSHPHRKKALHNHTGARCRGQYGRYSSRARRAARVGNTNSPSR
jgi:hypothetical protein